MNEAGIQDINTCKYAPVISTGGSKPSHWLAEKEHPEYQISMSSTGTMEFTMYLDTFGMSHSLTLADTLD